MNRYDETWHRLREWTNGQTRSERLAAQILLHEGYQNLDPSHPLGGKDGGKDATCDRDGKRWIMAVYFPRGQNLFFNKTKKKFCEDLRGVRANQADGLVFVTNQELALKQRSDLSNAAKEIPIKLFHLERITAILDKPEMYDIRKQFLGIDTNERSQYIFSLGGTGGQAPGAGGGGGGAFGANAQGGRGGRGGGIFIVDGQTIAAPGTGGEGGGYWGENTPLHERIVAMEFPPEFKINFALLANSVEVCDELVQITGGGINIYTVPSLPYFLEGCFLFSIEVESCTILARGEVLIRCLSPDSFCSYQSLISIQIDNSSKIMRRYIDFPFSILGSTLGIWNIQVLSTQGLLLQYPFEIRLASSL